MPQDPDYDLLVVGGGINGAGIARDAAGRGLAVVLVDEGDLAGARQRFSGNLRARYVRWCAIRLCAEYNSDYRDIRRLAGERAQPRLDDKRGWTVCCL